MFLIGIEARSLQQYVFASPRLCDMVGASEIINRACDQLPKLLLEKVGAPPGAVRFGAAGRTWIELHDEQQANAFMRLWGVLIDAFAPGLQMPAAMESYQGAHSERDAIDLVIESLKGRHAWPTLRTAELSPLVERSARTSHEAVGRGEHKELIDEVTRRQEAVGKAENTTPGGIKPPKKCSFPRDVSRIVGDSGGLAVLHADGNGVGAVVQQLRESAARENRREIDALAEFSRQLLKANLESVETGLQKVYAQFFATDDERQWAGELPVRPLVIGGDDVTMLLRSDLALPFAQAYAQEFARQSRDKVGQRLSVCTGIAVVRPNHPFRLAYAVAESLCDWAKKRGKAVATPCPSLVAFHRLVADVGEEYEKILETQLTSKGSGGDASRITLTAGPYAFEQTAGFWSFDKLGALADSLQEMPRGSLRQLLTQLSLESDDIQLAWSRIKELQPEQANRVGKALRELHGIDDPVSNAATPLLDAHNLSLLRRKRA